MDKHAKRSSLLHYPVLIVFTLFFVGLFALDLITPDRAYSELENTTLSQRPALTQLSAKGLNSYFTAYTKYVKDQVFGRDQWISLQSMVETTLLQKEQNGGILLGREHMMFPRTFGLLSSEERTLPKNTSAVESLCQRYPGKVNVLLAPAASDIYPENVPANAPLLDENTYLDQLSAAVQAAGGRFVDVRSTLTDHKGEYLYYRTDHHWTSLAARYAFETLSAQLDLQPVRSYTVYPVSDSFEGTLAAKTGSHWTSLGAYYAYQQLCDALGLTPFDTAAHTALTADRFYGTHYSKARTWNAVPDTITWYDLPNQLTIYNVTAAGQPTDGETTGLYDTDKLTVYDKYAMFLHGNNGLSRVQGDGTGKILVIKDSYANCFVPYLTANYADIDVVDFRNYNFGLDQLIADNDYDQILVLYSFDSFKSDPYLYRAGVTG